MVKNLSNFVDENLISKKQWIFNDNLINFLDCPLKIIKIITLLLHIDLIKKNIFSSIKIKIIVTYLIDLLSGLYHYKFIDHRLDKHKKSYYNKVKKEVVLETPFGYASNHHIFPSNWMNITDSIIYNSLYLIILILLIPILLIKSNKKSDSSIKYSNLLNVVYGQSSCSISLFMILILFSSVFIP
jgi:hypothetical protein